jgi:2-iminobutanoate/2-iminopropanoate deaminase
MGRGPERLVTIMARRAIYLDDYSHATGIPVASVVGPLLASSIIAPFNPGGRVAPETVEEQLANLFRHAGKILLVGGGNWDQVVRMTFYVADIATRDMINPVWNNFFPDKASMPARYTQLLPSGGGSIKVSADFWAYIG